MRNRAYTVEAGESGKALLEFLADRLGLSRGKAKQVLDARNVFVDRRRVWMARHILRAGQTVEIAGAAERRRRAPPIPVLWSDADCLVVDKPPGLLANGAGSAEDLLRAQFGEPELTAVHRLDRDTSGCLILARRPAAREALIESFRRRRVLKLYHAIVAGTFHAKASTVSAPIDGEAAVTHMRLIDAAPAASHLLIRIESGRTHQIRRHLAGLKHPVVGDRQYGTRAAADAATMSAPRQMLHASGIRFPHPAGGRDVNAHAPLPADFRQWLRRFGLDRAEVRGMRGAVPTSPTDRGRR